MLIYLLLDFVVNKRSFYKRFKWKDFDSIGTRQTFYNKNKRIGAWHNEIAHCDIFLSFFWLVCRNFSTFFFFFAFMAFNYEHIHGIRKGQWGRPESIWKIGCASQLKYSEIERRSYTHTHTRMKKICDFES